MKANCPVCKAVSALVILGALNWGAVGFFEYNFVTQVLGDATTAARAIYGLIGVAGVIQVLRGVKKGCPVCAKNSK